MRALLVVGIACCGWSVFTAAAVATPDFDFPSYGFDLLGPPAEMVSGDFNGDGIDDFAIVRGNDKRLQPLYNEGDGAFSGVAPSPAVTGTPAFLSVADLNGDTKPDFVVLGLPTSLNVYLADGPNSFTKRLFAVPAGPWTQVVPGDFDNDDRIDLVTVGGDPGTAFLARGAGDGDLVLPVIPIALGTGAAHAAVAADFDGDGHMDLVVGGGTAVRVLHGNGDATFDPPLLLATTTPDVDLAVADFDGDSRADLAAIDFNGGVTITLGTGALQPGGIVASPSTGFTDVGDVDGDMDLDVVVHSRVFANEGAGVFAAGVSYASGAVSLGRTCLIDVNVDGRLDIARADPSANRILVLLDRASGGFTSATRTYEMGLDPQPPIFVDLDADGDTDVLAANPNHMQVSLRLGQGDGTFGAHTALVLGGAPHGIACGDVNGDGVPDLIAASKSDANVRLALGNGNGTFGAVQSFPTGETPTQVVLADLDFDTHLDLVIADPGYPGSTEFFVRVRRGHGDGTFAPVSSVPVPVRVSALDLADMNADGNLDIVVKPTGENRLLVFLGAGGGAFGGAIESPFLFNIIAGRPVLADFDADGHIDAVTPQLLGTAVRLYRGQGDGTVAGGDPILIVTSAASVAVGDIDRDGQLDAVASLSARQALLPIFGGATYSAPFHAPASPYTHLQLTRIDGDARVDLVAFSEIGVSFTVYLDATFELPTSVPDPGPDVASMRGPALFAPVLEANGSLRIRYALARTEPVRLGVFDVRGRRLWSAPSPPAVAGTHTIVWEARAMAPLARGVYLVHLATPSASASRKLPVLVR